MGHAPICLTLWCGGQQDSEPRNRAPGLHGAWASGVGGVVSFQEKLQREQRGGTGCPDAPACRRSARGQPGVPHGGSQ